MVGQVVPVEIAVHNATSGVAGFDFQVALEALPGQPADVAKIVQVEFPSYRDPVFGIELTDVAGLLPGTTVGVRALDLSYRLEGAFAREVLLTVKVRLDRPGQARLTISVLRRLDPDGTGASLTPAIVAGTVAVATP